MGIGFVEFSSHAAAKKAIAGENGKDYEGRALKVNMSNEKPTGRSQSSGGGGGEPSATLFVGNVSFNTDQNSIREFFSECGDIKDVRIAMGDDGRPKGFAHIEFESVEAAQKALELNG